MRKYITLSLMSLALALGVVMSQTSASNAWEGYYYHKFNLAKFCKYHPSSHKCFHSETRSHNHTGQWAVACGIAAAGAEMIGAAVHGSDKKDPRESTIFEAGWYASACPVFLPWSLLVSATCPDNKATYEVARQAWRYGKKTGTYNLAVFTDAYGPACRTGKLAPEFLAFLKANHMPLSTFYLSARSKPVLHARG